MSNNKLYLYRINYEEFVAPLKSKEISDDVDFFAYERSRQLDTIDFKKYNHLIVTGDLTAIKRAIGYAVEHGLTMGIVPLSSQGNLAKMYDLPKDKDEAYNQALKEPKKHIDMLYCNDVVVLTDVRIGNTSAMKEFEYEYVNENIFKRSLLFWRAFRDKNRLKHFRYAINTEKDDIGELSAVGMIGFEHNNGSWISSVFSKYLGADDGMHILAILAPVSLFEYFVTQPLMLLIGKQNKKIPKSLGYIRSNSISVDCDQPQTVLIDDTESLQTPISLVTVPRELKLCVGDRYLSSGEGVKSAKSSVKLENVPRDNESIEYFSKGLPMFEHASQGMYASLFRNLREDSMISVVFVTMLILSALIATFGLFINSSSVIIGAMLIAPLMQPIVSLGMGALRRDITLQLNSIKTIIIGVLAVIMTSMSVAWMVPIDNLTSEMAGRLSPSILDLFVAIASGVAAAYAKNNEKILGSLAGVSIAVALVPPIAVAGVGLGWGNLYMFGSAFLLFITNLVGIVFAVAVTFMVLGYSPIKVAKRGLIVWLIAMSIVSIPLYNSFAKMKENARVQDVLTNLSFDIDGNSIKLAHIELIQNAKVADIRCDIILTKELTKKQKAYIKELILKSIGIDAEVIATFTYKL